MKRKARALSAIYLALFLVLILGGIALKRIWGHPEFMILFHLPAAVFLVLGGIEIAQNRKRTYDAEVDAVRKRFQTEKHNSHASRSATESLSRRVD